MVKTCRIEVPRRHISVVGGAGIARLPEAYGGYVAVGGATAKCLEARITRFPQKCSLEHIYS